jgi:Uma2 family endonuclease
VVTIEQARGPRLTEPPVLAVEVVSPTSRERDLVVKRQEYAASGLPWYWLVDLAAPEVVVLRSNGGAFVAEASVAEASAVGADHVTVEQPLTVTLRPTDLML